MEARLYEVFPGGCGGRKVHWTCPSKGAIHDSNFYTVGVPMFWPDWQAQKMRQHQNHFQTSGSSPLGSREGSLYDMLKVMSLKVKGLPDSLSKEMVLITVTLYLLSSPILMCTPRSFSSRSLCWSSHVLAILAVPKDETTSKPLLDLEI